MNTEPTNTSDNAATPEEDVVIAAAVEETVEVEVVATPKSNEKPAAEPAAPAPAPAPARNAAVATAVVGNGPKDAVLLSKCVFKNPATRKSLTVHHLQRRLIDLGFRDAAADKDGWYGDHTLRAVKAFQSANKLEGEGIVDAATLIAIFAGDPNVEVDTEN
jgi:peptidoglycan hydrolase-like protein with peptidoglycan-binding domain